MLVRRLKDILFVSCLLLVTVGAASAQTAAAPLSASAQTVAAVPDAPQPQPQAKAPERIPPGPAVPWLYRRLMTPGKPLTTEQKTTLYVHQSFGPPAFVAPAIGAAIRMARPPADYPRAWKDGGGAFGRLYGSTLATQTSKHTAEFVTTAIFHYDPRYFPSSSREALPRFAHAIAYVFVQKTDSGATAFALPHFAGAAAGGFTGMAYLPPGYDTLSRASQRAGSELGQIAIRNLAEEFAPELAPIARWIHLPKLVPIWWVPTHKAHPAQP